MTKNPVGPKIRITQTVDELIKHGPSINIGVCAVPITGTGLVAVVAQIDTGATGTGISPRLAKKLKLEPIDIGEARIAGHQPMVCPYFRVRLHLPKTEIETDVIGLSTLNPPHDVLLGRDILANCRFIVDFLSGITALHIKSSS